MCGVGAEISAIVAKKAFTSLKAPVLRVTGVPVPSSYMLGQAFIPQTQDIVDAVVGLLD
jgi:pyruvate dehydrogenase E1 component beta subunit